VHIEELKALVRDVPDFPKPGILFKDITPLLAHPGAMKASARLLGQRIEDHGATALVGIESRGFIFGSAVAALTDLPVHLVRKPGKLPYKTVGVDYDLEYGSDRLEIHADAIEAGRRYAIIDDLLATGGTASATVRLIQEQGGIVATAAFLIELVELGGRKHLGEIPVEALIHY
jgi:adenine phosphoribosyltransferase